MSREAQLADLYDRYRTDPHPLLKRLRSYAPGIKLVPGEGSMNPRVLVIGEAPGGFENLRGRPFVGASGRVIRSLMMQCGLSTHDIPPEDDGQEPNMAVGTPANAFITNAVKYRPSLGNRTPTDAEIDVSRPYLRKEWAILGRPRVIITAGRPALFAITGEHRPLTQVVGVPILLKDGKTWVYPMYHPSFALQNESFRPKVEKQWDDFHDWLTRLDQDNGC